MPGQPVAEFALFQPLERRVIGLARGERGTGCLPESGLGARLYRLLVALALVRRVSPLADPRLETLRSFVNRAYNRRTRRKDVDALVRAGFSASQIEALMRG